MGHTPGWPKNQARVITEGAGVPDSEHVEAPPQRTTTLGARPTLATLESTRPVQPLDSAKLG